MAVERTDAQTINLSIQKLSCTALTFVHSVKPTIHVKVLTRYSDRVQSEETTVIAIRKNKCDL